MFSKYNMSLEGKIKIEKNTLDCLLDGRQELNEFKKKFTIHNLLEYRDMFSFYLKQYGDNEPMQTSYSWLNRAGNYLLTYSHFIHTNQGYANRAKRIIEDTKKIVDDAKEHKHNVAQKHVKAVFDAVLAIKQIDDEMNAKNISGEVRKTISKTLDKFNLNKNGDELHQQIFEIEYLIERIPEINSRARIHSVVTERLSSF